VREGGREGGRERKRKATDTNLLLRSYWKEETGKEGGREGGLRTFSC
jgi:hypothetical protein